MSEEEREPTAHIKKLVDQAIHTLGEHCSSVRIFCTYPTHDGEACTAGHTSGCGDFYAQLGLIDEWIITQREYVKHKARKDADEPEE